MSVRQQSHRSLHAIRRIISTVREKRGGWRKRQFQRRSLQAMAISGYRKIPLVANTTTNDKPVTRFLTPGRSTLGSNQRKFCRETTGQCYGSPPDFSLFLFLLKRFTIPNNFKNFFDDTRDSTSSVYRWFHTHHCLTYKTTLVCIGICQMNIRHLVVENFTTIRGKFTCSQ